MTNEQQLLSLYNQLDEVLRDYYGDNNRNDSMIMKAINDFSYSSNAKYEEYGRKLNMIRIIRNDLIHNLDMNKDHLIQISDDMIIFLEEMIKALKNPLRAYDIATKLKNLSYIKIKDKDIKINYLISLMREKGFTQLPVLKENNSLFGVFSSNVLFHFLKNYKGNIEDLSLENLMNDLPVQKHFSERYYFVPSNKNIADLSQIMINGFKNNEKPAMLFVTQSGKESEPILGVIVIEDIIKAS